MKIREPYIISHVFATIISVTLELRLRKSLIGKLLDYYDAILFKTFCYQNVFVHTKRQASVFKFLQFQEPLLEGLQGKVVLTVEI